MRKIIDYKGKRVGVDVIDNVIEICVGDDHGEPVMLRITQEAGDEVCERVIEERKKGASPGEEV